MVIKVVVVEDKNILRDMPKIENGRKTNKSFAFRTQQIEQTK